MSHIRQTSMKRTNYAALAGPGDWWTPPDDDGLTDCPVCDAKGWRWVLNDDNTSVRVECEACEGARYLDESGYPVKDEA
jgi:hypothetical protein